VHMLCSSHQKLQLEGYLTILSIWKMRAKVSRVGKIQTSCIESLNRFHCLKGTRLGLATVQMVMSTPLSPFRSENLFNGIQKAGCGSQTLLNRVQETSCCHSIGGSVILSPEPVKSLVALAQVQDLAKSSSASNQGALPSNQVIGQCRCKQEAFN
jgi:hypothetical protein